MPFYVNPNYIGVKYSLVILGVGGGKLSDVSVCPYLLVKNNIFLDETLVIVMIKTVSNGDIYFYQSRVNMV